MTVHNCLSNSKLSLNFTRPFSVEHDDTWWVDDVHVLPDQLRGRPSTGTRTSSAATVLLSAAATVLLSAATTVLLSAATTVLLSAATTTATVLLYWDR